MADLPTLSNATPEDFIDYYFNNLKTDLGVFDIEIAKVGFIGFLMNLLGNTHFDVKTYYDGLFKEAFVATAQSEESQNLHAAIYGYTPAFAIPATATGSIEFDFNTALSTKNPKTVKREVFIGYRTTDPTGTTAERIGDITFNSSVYKFTIDALYKFVQEITNPGTPSESSSYYTEVTTVDGTKIIIPSSSAYIIVPLYSTTQYNYKTYEFQIPKYNLGSFQTYYFTIDSGYYLSAVEVYITPTGGVEEEYEVQFVKYLASGDDKTVFLKKISSTNYMLEFGSGTRGVWVSQYNARVVIKYCEGTAGNLIDSSSTKIAINCETYSKDYEIDPITGNLIPFSGQTIIKSNSVVTDFESSNGGTNSLSGDNLRNEIVNFIQSRDNLVSETDFYNITSENTFLKDFKFLFKKTNVYDNIFHLYRAFRDRNQEICYTTDYLLPIVNINLSPENLILTSIVGTGSLIPGHTYAYRVSAYDSWGVSIPCDEVSIILAVGSDSVRITWDAMNNAVGYRIYGRTVSSQGMYWDTTDLFIVDDGSAGTPEIVPSGATLTDMIYDPVFFLDDSFSCTPDSVTNIFSSVNHGLDDDDVICFSGTGGGVTVQTYYYIIDSIVDSFKISLSRSGTAVTLTDNIVNGFFRPFISPFFYKGNSRLGYFDGYILDQNLLVQFSEVILSTNTIGTGFDVPVIYLNLNYNMITETTILQVKSYQDISALQFVITVFGSTIANQTMVWNPVTDAFEWNYTNSLTFGIMEEELQIEVVGYEFTTVFVERFRSRTSSFYQILNISDQLRLFRYVYGTNMYILNLPVIYYGGFISDSDYYLDKIYEFMISASFQNNRMITDNVQGRFLNTYIIKSPVIENCLVQKGEVFSDYNWLVGILETLDEPYLTVPLVGDRYRVSTTPVGGSVFDGHANEIAIYAVGGWTFYIPIEDDGVFDATSRFAYIWDSSAWVSIPSIRLPLKMIVNIKVNKDYTDRNPTDLGQVKTNLILTLADHLQTWRTGVNIKFYSSQIVDIIHNNRPWVKSVVVLVTDSSPVPNSLNNGIEIITEDLVVLGNLPDKLEILKYIPPMIYWDINNIVVNLSI